MADASPDFVFHLAAQPLVRLSYEEPGETWNTNVNGTVHVLEALRKLDRPCCAIVVTSDKCYENHETGQAYREGDSLGGFDTYSASKGAVEIAVAAWRRSFFLKHHVRVASARAGNVIGGGDWAADRIVPDCVRAFREAKPVLIRNKNAVRPWQHVLEPLSGYLWLAASLSTGRWAPSLPQAASSSAFNFGPAEESNRTVEDLITEALKHWHGAWIDKTDPTAVHEANLLALATDKARKELRWKPVWNFEEAVYQTIWWYAQQSSGASVRQITESQIEQYGASAASKRLAWASGA